MQAIRARIQHLDLRTAVFQIGYLDIFKRDSVKRKRLINRLFGGKTHG